MDLLRKALAYLLATGALMLGLAGDGGRGSRRSRWRLALWAISVALIAGAAGGVRMATAETVSQIDSEVVAAGEEAEGDLTTVEPDMLVSCYCTAAPPDRW